MVRNNRITIRKRVTGSDTMGQPLTTWQDFATLWGGIRHLTGAAAIKANADISAVRASISVRRRADIEPGMQAVHGTTVYEIKAILPDRERRLDMFLVCEVLQ